ncbi:MAG: class I SAM-dependent methyltransferase [Verrucomicrobia bacterium]|nr:class I SAM-dependent methyltransferase [Verrucomicrobiota bacterium]
MPCSALVLDACCGPRMMWFDNADARAIYMDRREQVVKGAWGPASAGRKDVIIKPDLLASFTEMPFADETFFHVVFDPPHIQRMEATGKVSQTFGVLAPGWEEMLRAGFSECFRVLKPGGTLIFKWCEVEVPLARVLALTPEKPLYGHRSGKKAQTHWVAFLKQNVESSYA